MLRSYSGTLAFSVPLSRQVKERIVRTLEPIVGGVALDPEEEKFSYKAERYFKVRDSTIAVEYEGSDHNGKIALGLKAIAPIVKDAVGEIECRCDDSVLGPHSSFYFSVAGGKLMVQEASVVRSVKILLPVSAKLSDYQRSDTVRNGDNPR